MNKYWVVSNHGRVMSDAFSNKVDAQACADSLMVDFPDDYFYVVDKI